jgi:hypothetical protein
VGDWLGIAIALAGGCFGAVTGAMALAYRCGTLVARVELQLKALREDLGRDGELQRRLIAIEEREAKHDSDIRELQKSTAVVKNELRRSGGEFAG